MQASHRSLWTRVPVNVLGKAAEDDPSTRAAGTHRSDLVDAGPWVQSDPALAIAVIWGADQESKLSLSPAY